MKYANKKKIQPLFGAIVALSAASAVSAASYQAVLSGFAIDETFVAVNVPGVFVGPQPPAYQVPRLAAYAGPGQGNGWPSQLALSIDADSGAVTDFIMTFTTSQIVGDGLTNQIRPAGRHYIASNTYKTTTGCSVTNNANDSDNLLEYVCPDVPADLDAGFDPADTAFAVLKAPGSICATTAPSLLEPGVNGCLFAWSFPDTENPQTATRSGVAIETNAIIDNVPLSIGAGNPELYVSVDPGQNSRSVGFYESRGYLTGGKFSVHHTGTLAGGDFSVTRVDVEHEQEFFFFIDSQPWAPLRFITLSELTFDTLVSQDILLLAKDAKHVPAMGFWGVISLFFGLTVSAAAISRRRGDTAKAAANS